MTISIVNQYGITPANNNYGLATGMLANSDGNALVAVVGWNSATINAVSNVSDDANNWWQHLGTADALGDVRCSVWIAPNARPATLASVGMSWFTLGLAGMVFEMSGMPDIATLDFAVQAFYSNGTSGTATLSGTATQADIAFTLGCFGNNTGSITAPGTPWTLAGSASINDPGGAGGPGDTKLITYWQTPSAGAVSAAWSWSPTATVPAAGLLVAIKQSPTLPVLKNLNRPLLKVEAAFGYSPGDPTQMPTYTDVTSYAIGEDGDVDITAGSGTDYELDASEAGELSILLNNQQGDWTPGNTASPFYPNVVLGMPVRVTAQWPVAGRWRTYPVGHGYVDHLPLQWAEDMPQFGVVKLEAADGLTVLANSILPSCLAGEILIDQPYFYLPLSEDYASQQAGGLPFSNLSRTNLKPGVGMNGVGRSGSYPGSTGFVYHYLETGLPMSLTGDQGSGSGISVYSGTVNNASPAILYQDPSLPNVQNSPGVTFEFWNIMPSTITNQQLDMFRISGRPGNYGSNPYGGGRVMLQYRAGSPQGLWLILSQYDKTDAAVSYVDGGALYDGKPHHYAVTVQKGGTGSNYYTYAVYVDGIKQISGTGSTVLNTGDWDTVAIGPAMDDRGGAFFGWNYWFAHAAYYATVLPATRIQAHYNAGLNAYAGDTDAARVQKILTWGGIGLARAGDAGSVTPLLGPADSIQGQDVSSAIGDVGQATGGTLLCTKAGNIKYMSRQGGLYNKPVRWTFGDRPDLGEIPYLPAGEYGYDNVRIQNVRSVGRTVNNSGTRVKYRDLSSGQIITVAPNASGATATAGDNISKQQYFTRVAPDATAEVTRDQDVYDNVNFGLTKTRQPTMRVERIILDPVSNPSIWPVALAAEKGDICRVNRRPLGGAAISELGIVKKVEHGIGPNDWPIGLEISPYQTEAAVLQADAANYDVVGSNALAW